MKENKLLAKLRQPVHISFISTHIFKKDINETKEIINELIKDEIVEESSYAKDYYVLKNQSKK